MAEGNVQETRPASSLSRRQLIRRGMVAGGVVLWSAPVVAAASFNRHDARQRIAERLGQARSGSGSAPGAEAAAPPPPVVVQAPGCTSYPPGSCITFECGGSHQVCGAGAGGFECFCDVDATSSCVCRNDAFCGDLLTCIPGNGNGDCDPGYFCIPTSCCGVAKCAPPCGTLPPGGRQASPGQSFLPILNSFLPNLGTVSGL